MKKIKYIIILFTFFILNLFALNANANSEIPFSIAPIKTANQLEKNAGYIDVVNNPSASQDVKVMVSNNSNKPQKFIVDASDATTSDGLSIDYVPKNQKLIGNDTFSHTILNKDHQQRLLLNAHSSSIVTFNLKFPYHKFDGIIMGGISVYQDDNNSNQNNNHQGISINNKFVYSIAVLLRNNSKNNVKPNLSAGNVFQTTLNYRPVIKTSLTNDKNNFIRGLSTNTVIKNSDGKTVADNNTTLGQVAPISKFHLVTPLSNELSTGTYTLYGHAKDANNHSWSWVKRFDVTGKNENETKNNLLNDDSGFNPIYILYILILILILIIIFILYRYKKYKDNH